MDDWKVASEVWKKEKMADEGWKIEEWWVREGKIEVADDEDIERLLQMNISR